MNHKTVKKLIKQLKFKCFGKIERNNQENITDVSKIKVKGIKTYLSL